MNCNEHDWELVRSHRGDGYVIAAFKCKNCNEVIYREKKSYFIEKWEDSKIIDAAEYEDLLWFCKRRKEYNK